MRGGIFSLRRRKQPQLRTLLWNSLYVERIILSRHVRSQGVASTRWNSARLTCKREREREREKEHVYSFSPSSFYHPYKNKRISGKIVRENKCILVERRCVLITWRGIPFFSLFSFLSFLSFLSPFSSSSGDKCTKRFLLKQLLTAMLRRHFCPYA